MAVIYQPDSTCAVIDLCEADRCPQVMSNCGRGCFELFACKVASFPIDLGCDPATGEDLQAAQVLGLVARFYHETMTGRVIDGIYDLANDPLLFTTPTQFNYLLTLPGSETVKLPGGSIRMEIEITTSTGSWILYDFKVCVEVELLQPPEICVTGADGGDTSFTVNGADVTLWFHESDIIHAHKTWDRFTVAWGDGTETTLDVSALQPADGATWFLTHTYAGTGTYTFDVTGYSDYDETDPCDVELSDCGSATICIQA